LGGDEASRVGRACKGDGVKFREPRLNVMIQARVRVGASWNDACILNLSSRGMMVRAASAPNRGSYLEIRRGNHLIVARVVWSNADRFGVYTQDPIPAAELVRGASSSSAATAPADGGSAERRTAPRPMVATSDRSRWRARAMEFCTMGFLGCVAAVLLLGAVSEMFGRPLAAVEQALTN
jgi:hypothetical protein